MGQILFLIFNYHFWKAVLIFFSASSSFSSFHLLFIALLCFSFLHFVYLSSFAFVYLLIQYAGHRRQTILFFVSNEKERRRRRERYKNHFPIYERTRAIKAAYLSTVDCIRVFSYSNIYHMNEPQWKRVDDCTVV